MADTRMTRDEVTEAVAALVARARATPSDCMLETAAAAASAMRAAEAILVEAVVTARSRGHSWAEVGAALGVSRQAAWERFVAVAGAPGQGTRCRRARGSHDRCEPCPAGEDAPHLHALRSDGVES